LLRKVLSVSLVIVEFAVDDSVDSAVGAMKRLVSGWREVIDG